MVIEEKPNVVVDFHEERSGLVDGLKRLGLNVTIAELPVGDIMYVGERGSCLLERKTGQDYSSSITDQRLFAQCIKMSRAREEFGYDVAFLLEGDSGKSKNKEEMENFGPDLYPMWRKRFTGVKAAQVINSFISVSMGFGIPILWADKPYTSGLIIKGLAKFYGKSKSSKDKIYALRQSVKASATMDEKSRYILEGLPMISASRADVILKKYGDIMNALQNVDGWSSIRGIGPKIVESTREVLCHKYGG